MNLQIQSDSINQRLKHAMQQRGITATNLAYSLGVSKSSVSDWLKGGGLSMNNIAAIAMELNVSLDWLLQGKGCMHLFGPIHPTDAEMQLIRQLRRAGENTFNTFFNMLCNMAKPMLGEDPVKQILALEMLRKSRLPMAVVSHDGFVLDLNENCLELLGDHLDKQRDVIGSHFAEWILETDLKLAFRNMQESMKKGHGTNFSCTLRRRPAKQANNQATVNVILSSVFHGTETKGHFECLIFPLN